MVCISEAFETLNFCKNVIANHKGMSVGFHAIPYWCLCVQKGLKSVLDGSCLQECLRNGLDSLCFQKGLKNVLDGLLDGLCL